MYWRSVKWWSELTGHFHLSRAVHGGVRKAKIYQKLNGQENCKHPPALRLQKASLLALASFRLATRYPLRGKRIYPSVCQAGMASGEGCSLAVGSSTQNSLHPIKVEDLPSPKCRAQGLGRQQVCSLVSPWPKFCYSSLSVESFQKWEMNP